MRVLVIGGTGLSGPFLVRRLIAEGHTVAIFHRGLEENEALLSEVEHLHGDKNQLPEFLDLFRRFAPDVVVHMVAFTEQDARTLMDLFRGLARRVVVPSSIDVYRAYGRLHRTEPGPPDPVPLTEDAPLREHLSIHGAEYEKRDVERIVMHDPELPGTILRLPAIYGPGDRRLSGYVKRMNDMRPAILLDETLAQWRFSRAFSENVAEAIALATIDEQATRRIYNVGEPEALTEAEWVRRIGRAADWPGDVIAVKRELLPEALIPTADLSQHWVVDTTRIRQELGYRETVPQDEALRRTIAWERANPPTGLDPTTFDYVAEDAVIAALR